MANTNWKERIHQRAERLRALTSPPSPPATTPAVVTPLSYLLDGAVDGALVEAYAREI